ncbi:peroxiredoxin family protein [Hydrogenophaga luteola]|uniref:Peroxiredoxin family protein n=1 Tax=Hydrogenophaga luteola TaxID=1591122 RepID=A0ABV7VYI0_9BURK
MRLVPGQMAPDVQTTDFLGTPVHLAKLRGSKVLLSFHRYASCPICNLHMRELIRSHPALHDAGLSVVSVFQSPAASIAKYVGRGDTPFPILPDPGLALYRRYGVERRWTALVTPATLATAWQAVRSGFRPGVVEGPVDRTPADFLIDEQGAVVRAHYGRDLGDHIALDELMAWAHGAVQPIPAIA